MRIRGSGLAAVCVAAIVQSAPAAAQEESVSERLDKVERGKVRDQLIELKAEVDRYEAEWLAAKVALDTATEALGATDKRLKRNSELRTALSEAEDPTLAAMDKKLRDEQEAKVKEARDALDPKWQRYRFERNRFQRYLAAAGKWTAPAPLEIAPTLLVKPVKDKTCSIDSEKELIALDPNQCRWTAEEASRHAGPSEDARSASAVSLPDRPLERRGVTAQITTSGTTTLSLKIADTFSGRSINTDEDADPEERFQRAFNWGYSLGVEADVGESKGQIFGFAEDEDEDTRAIDRIDQRAKLTGSLNFNWFDGESRSSFVKRGAKMQSDAQEACRKDQAAKPPVFRSTCGAEDLLAWIFAQKEDGSYANPTHVEAFNAVYWGPKVKTARIGFGFNGSVALPRSEYHPFAVVGVPDPFRPGKTKKVVDTANLPASFLAEKPLRERHWAYDLGAYGFYRLTGEPSPVGLTIVPSISYKHDYENPDKISLCPVQTPGTVLTSQLCESVQAADAELKESWVPAIELRVRFAGAGFLGGRGLIPEIGIAPKLGQDLDANRWSFDMPIWFTADDKGKLNGGLIFARQWGGRKDDGTRRDSSTSMSVFLGTTFDLGSGK